MKKVFRRFVYRGYRRFHPKEARYAVPRMWKLYASQFDPTDIRGIPSNGTEVTPDEACEILYAFMETGHIPVIITGDFKHLNQVMINKCVILRIK